MKIVACGSGDEGGACEILRAKEHRADGEGDAKRRGGGRRKRSLVDALRLPVSKIRKLTRALNPRSLRIHYTHKTHTEGHAAQCFKV